VKSPALVAHADWSATPAKRWCCIAVRDRHGAFRVEAPAPVGRLGDFFAALRARAGRRGPVLVGFDFPLGLPRRYARAAGIGDFRAFLARAGRGRFRAFYEVAGSPREIALERPFFPVRAGDKGEFGHRHLIAGLGLADKTGLYRAVDYGRGYRPDAAAMFWTLGPKQVGKATIAGWRDLVAPALRADDAIALWPFDGSFADCLASAALTVVEAYPAEYYRHLDLPLVRAGSKRDPIARRRQAPTIVAWARANGVALVPALRGALGRGFGDRADGEDRFDAVVGTLGILNVVLGNRAPGEPDDPLIRRVEGWTLGQLP
jgi:hypothetical protein